MLHILAEKPGFWSSNVKAVFKLAWLSFGIITPRKDRSGSIAVSHDRLLSTHTGQWL